MKHRMHHAVNDNINNNYRVTNRNCIQLKTICGLWINPEQCTEDLKAECGQCKRKIRLDKKWSLEHEVLERQDQTANLVQHQP
jgi:uncharacterized paraquat-inducible protein A